jgi:hypothetical protein
MVMQGWPARSLTSISGLEIGDAGDCLKTQPHSGSVINH